MNGLLLVDKPEGWTSHDVVAKVRSILRQLDSNRLTVDSQKKGADKLVTDNWKLVTPSPKVKVGHTGTLDPAATGLLILVLGSYTKRAGEFSKLDKTYEAELTLGATSTTGDVEGEITVMPPQQHQTKSVRSDTFCPSFEEVKEVLKSFIGEIKQTPHKYSAIKIGGQRAYKLARQGKEVKLEPRQVTVNRLQVTEYKYPLLKIITEVSSGTYIRSLAEDIGEKLGTGAYLSALRRTKVGKFDIKNALTMDDITAKMIDNLKLVA